MPDVVSNAGFKFKADPQRNCREIRNNNYNKVVVSSEPDASDEVVGTPPEVMESCQDLEFIPVEEAIGDEYTASSDCPQEDSMMEFTEPCIKMELPDMVNEYLDSWENTDISTPATPDIIHNLQELFDFKVPSMESVQQYVGYTHLPTKTSTAPPLLPVSEMDNGYESQGSPLSTTCSLPSPHSTTTYEDQLWDESFVTLFPNLV